MKDRALPPEVLAGHRGHCLACSKTSWSSRKVAKKVARRGHPGAQQLVPYLCPDGRGWHLGHLNHTREYYRGNEDS